MSWCNLSSTTSFLLKLLLSLVVVVKSETQMCRRISQSAETHVVDPTDSKACVRMRVTPGRRYNSLNLYLWFTREGGSSCALPHGGTMLLSLQVVNEVGFPVGEPLVGFQNADIPENQCDHPADIAANHTYDSTAELQVYPCFYDENNLDGYKQDASYSYRPGVFATLLQNQMRPKTPLFYLRVTWVFADKEIKGAKPNRLVAIGEVLDLDKDIVIEFTSSNWVKFKYKYQTGSSSPAVTKGDCSDNPTIQLEDKSGFVFSDANRYFYKYRNNARLNGGKPPGNNFELTIDGFTPKFPPFTDKLTFYEKSHFACRRLKPNVIRVAENKDSRKCIKLEAFPSPSGDNTAFISLSYVKGTLSVPECARWKTSEWVMEAYDDNKHMPFGSPFKDGSFVHFSGAGVSRDRYPCDTSARPNFIKILDVFKNLQCLWVPSLQNEWGQPVRDKLTPYMIHVKSEEFFKNNGSFDELGVHFVWKFDLLQGSSTSFQVYVRFMVEAYLPYQNLVLVLTAENKLRLTYINKKPEPLNANISCFSNKNTRSMTVKPIRNVKLPTITYPVAVCASYGWAGCDDLEHEPELKEPSYTCREWRPETNRTKKAGDCFSLFNSPSRQENSVLLTLRLETACLPQFEVDDFAFGAYNENGYPVGKLEASFSVYSEQANQKCEDTWEPKDYKEAEIEKYTNYDCFYYPEKADKYIQQVSSGHMPTFFYGKASPLTVQDTSTRYIVWRVLWDYSQPANYPGKHPTIILFEVEVNLKSRESVIIVLSKQPITFKYIAGAKENPPGTPCNQTFSPQHSIKVEPERPNPFVVDPDKDLRDRCKATSSCVVPPTILPPTPPPPRPKPGPPPQPGDKITREPLPVVVVPTEPPEPVIEGGPPEAPEPPPRHKKFKKPTNVYEGCVERTKGCVVPPKGSNPRECLRSRTCELVVAFQRQDVVNHKLNSDDFVVLEMYHQDPGEWFAIGLNPSQPRMADSYVLECVDEGLRDGPVIYNSRNLAGGKYANKRFPEDDLEGAHLIIDKQESYRKGREIYCRFHIKVQFQRSMGIEGNEKRFFDLHKMPFYIIAAWGAEFFAGAKGNLRRHKPSHFMRPEEGASHKTVLGARYAPTPGQKTLIVSHGVVMLWVVLFCVPVGSFIGRYFKETFPTLKIRKRKFPIWLIMHVGVMILGLGLLIYAMWSEIEGHKKWVSLRKSKLHTWLGGITGGLFVLTFLLGCFSKVSIYGKWNPMGVAHGLLGHGLFIVSLVLVFRMDDVSFGNAPCTVKYIAAALVFTYFVFYGVLAYHYRWVDWIVGVKDGRGACGILPINVLSERAVTELVEIRKSRGEVNTREYFADKNKDDIITAPGQKVRIGSLVLLALLSVMYVGWASLIIMSNQRGPCIPLDKFKD